MLPQCLQFRLQRFVISKNSQRRWGLVRRWSRCRARSSSCERFNSFTCILRHRKPGQRLRTWGSTVRYRSSGWSPTSSRTWHRYGFSLPAADRRCRQNLLLCRPVPPSAPRNICSIYPLRYNFPCSLRKPCALAFSCIESSFQLFVCYTVLQKTVFTCILLPDPVWIFPRAAKNKNF